MKDWFEVSRLYAEKFGEAFPTYGFGGSEEEMIAEMERCIESGEPYEPDYEVDGEPVEY